MKQNKKRKQTLESGQYRLEINFKSSKIMTSIFSVLTTDHYCGVKYKWPKCNG